MTDSIPLYAVTILLNRLENIGKQGLERGAARDNLHKIIRSWWKKALESHGFDCLCRNIYGIFRLLLPCQDFGRKYHLREPSIVEHLSVIFGIRGTRRGQRLIEWKVCQTAQTGQGNLGTVCEEVVRLQEPNVPREITVEEVNILLDELASYNPSTTESDGSCPQRGQRNRQEALRDLFRDQQARECKWLVRVILQYLGLVFSWRSIMNAFHPYLYRLHCIQTDLRLTSDRLIDLLRDPTKHKFEDVMRSFGRPALGICISVQECSQGKSIAHAMQVQQRNNESVCFAEIKYDGERMQAHVDLDCPDRQITIFSKSRRNSTNDRYLAHDIIRAALGLAVNCPHIDAAVRVENRKRRAPVRSIIVEGELLVYDEDQNVVEGFGGIRDFRPISMRNGFPERSHHVVDPRIVSGRRHLQIVFYDLLHLNGEDWTYRSLQDRRKALETIIHVIPNWVRLSEVQRFKVPRDMIGQGDIEPLRKYFADVIAQREEGLIVKGASSPYVPGRTSHWLKLKPDYMSGLGDTAEFAIIGGSYDPTNQFLGLRLEEYGQLVNVFFVGCLTNKERVVLQDEEPEFVCLFSFEAGFGRHQLIEFCNMLAPIRVRATSGGNLPYTYQLSQFHGKIDFLFKIPQAVELLFAGVCRSGNSWVPRHPRLLRQCGTDRDWRDTVSVQELQQMGENSGTAGMEDLLCVLDEEHLNKKRGNRRIHKFKRSKTTSDVIDLTGEPQMLIDLTNEQEKEVVLAEHVHHLVRSHTT